MNVTLFGNRVSADDQVKMVIRVGLIQFNWYPYKKGKFGHKDRHVQREDEVKTNGDHHLQTKECLRLPQVR